MTNQNKINWTILAILALLLASDFFLSYRVAECEDNSLRVLGEIHEDIASLVSEVRLMYPREGI